MCHYCGERMPSSLLESTPAVGDDQRWAMITPYHNFGCRWIESRGLRLDEGVRHDALVDRCVSRPRVVHRVEQRTRTVLRRYFHPKELVMSKVTPVRMQRGDIPNVTSY